jgi:hypothetical protein
MRRMTKRSGLTRRNGLVTPMQRYVRRYNIRLLAKEIHNAATCPLLRSKGTCDQV